MGCTYVKEFDFGTKGADGKVRYATGGRVKTPKVEALDRRELTATPNARRESTLTSRKVEGSVRRALPVAPQQPLVAMKKGGPAKCSCGGAAPASSKPRR